MVSGRPKASHVDVLRFGQILILESSEMFGDFSGTLNRYAMGFPVLGNTLRRACDTPRL